MELDDSGVNYLESILMLKNKNRFSHRQQMLTAWLTALGVSPETASQDACRMEHVIS